MNHAARLAFAALIALAIPSSAFASQEEEWKDIAPAGWKVISAAEDRQTADGSGNAVLVIEKDDPANRIKNDGLGGPELNTNPRHLLFVTRTRNVGWVTGRIENFLPPEGDFESPCLADPLEDGGVSLAKGVVTVSLHYWLSCGSYGVTHKEYKFRKEGARYRLIGLDVNSYSRSTGMGDESSINYLTGRKSVTSGVVVMEPEDGTKPGPPKISWSRIGKQRFYLDSMDRKACDDYESSPSWCGE